MDIAVNLEWLFDEAGSTADRIRAAHAAGVSAVEIWSWRDKDLPGIKDALAETGLRLVTMIVDPQLQITDPATHADYIEAVRDSAATAADLRVPFIVAVTGDERLGLSRASQHAAVVAVLQRAAQVLEATGVVLLLENLNDRVDHPGTYLTSVGEALDIVREVNSPFVRLLLDAYHSIMMGHDLTELTTEDVALIGHVQIADVPGRHEPGSGTVDWTQVIAILRARGYQGMIGLECLPTVSTAEALKAMLSVIGGPNPISLS